MKDFLAWSKKEHANKPNTHLCYETCSKALLNFFKDKPIDEIESEDVEKFKHWRIGQQVKARGKSPNKKTVRPTVKPATVNRELACLKILFNRFIKNDVLIKNPASRIKLFNEDNGQTRVVSEAEAQLYLTEASQPLKDIAALMIETGMRPEEIFRMEKANVYLEKGYIYIPFGKTKSAKRKIPLTTRATDIIAKRFEAANDKHLFVSEKTGKLITTLKTAHHGAIKRSKVEYFRIYDLRHTFATRFVESGGDIVTLKTLLGHSNIQMVTRYAHPTEKHQFEAIKNMEAKRS
jgi:integrase